MSRDIDTGGIEDRRPYIGSRMRIGLQWVRDYIQVSVAAAGFEGLGRFHVGMFQYPTADGVRPTELAESLQITKQSVNDLLRDMEARGYLTLVTDPTDGRARIIRLTATGHELEQATHDAAREASEAFEQILGTRRYAALYAALDEVVAHIVAGDMPIPPGSNA
jgi:DNA-binding MarR family transcriptional regulator